MLLTAVPGATSFEYLRTVDGVLHPTFKEACQQLGLLNDDAECHAALEEATFKDMPRQIRYLFRFFYRTMPVPTRLRFGQRIRWPCARTWLICELPFDSFA